MGFWSRINRTVRRVGRSISSQRRAISGRTKKAVGSKVKRTYSKFKSKVKTGIGKTIKKEPKSEMELKNMVDSIVNDTLRELLPEFPEAREDPTGETEEALKAEIYREVFIQLDELAKEEEKETRRT